MAGIPSCLRNVSKVKLFYCKGNFVLINGRPNSFLLKIM